MWKQIFFRGIVARSLFGVILSMACPVNANAGSPASGGPLIYATDRAVYKQGDVVKIGVTNTSDVRVAIVDRIHIDGGFATIEEQAENGQWRAIELYAAANVTVVRALEPGERYQYVCQTARLGWSKS